jgi:serine/threonine protein kinase
LVAVKAFSKESTFSQEKGKESLLNEMNLMRQLDDKNIMKLYGVFESENSIYITVELL